MTPGTSPNLRNTTGSPTALITGGARRLGRTLATALAKAGYDLIIHYHTASQDAETLRAEIEASGQTAHAIQADLTDRDQAKTLISRAIELAGTIDLLINNASQFEPDRIASLDGATLVRNIALHLEAPALLTAALAQAGRPAHIINIIDQRAFNLRPGYTSYTLAKSALWTLTRLAAIELAPAIRVNAIAPGLTLEPKGSPGPSFNELAPRLTLSGELTSPDEIVEAMLFLEKAKSVTGQAIILDGGQHLGWRVVNT